PPLADLLSSPTRRSSDLVGLGLDESVLTGIRHRLQIDCRARAARVVEPAHLRQIRVGEDVPVQHEERPRYEIGGVADSPAGPERDRKSTRLNSSHVAISY